MKTPGWTKVANRLTARAYRLFYHVHRPDLDSAIAFGMLMALRAWRPDGGQSLPTWLYQQGWHRTLSALTTDRIIPPGGRSVRTYPETNITPPTRDSDEDGPLPYCSPSRPRNRPRPTGPTSRA